MAKKPTTPQSPRRQPAVPRVQVDVPLPPARGGRIRVRAIKLLFDRAQCRRRPGDVFTIGSMEEFSHNSMELVDKRVPLKTTGPQEALSRENERLAEEKGAGAARRGEPADPDDSGIRDTGGDGDDDEVI